MIVTLEQIQAGIMRYVELEIGAKATGISKFAIYFMIPSLPRLIAEKLSDIKQSGVFPELFDSNGNVNIDEVRKRALEAIRHSGKVYIKELGYFADEFDIEAVYNYIKNS